MEITLREVTIGEVVAGYANNQEDGIVGYGGRLNIRPPYQREFVYKDKQRDAVINTIRKGFPLNVMYWVKIGDDAYELMDGQQRTLSLCEYVASVFALEYQFFHNLTEDEQREFLAYKLLIYVCEGTDREKLEWFEVINTVGVKLEPQEIKNAVYHGPFVSDARRRFSKTHCPAYKSASKYIKGSAIRQDYLETVLDWVSKGNIAKHMAEHQQDPDAEGLWLYFRSVINWVETKFSTYRKEMQGVNFGYLYDTYGGTKVNAAELEREVARLMQDEDVTCKAGIYTYVFDREQRHLNIRKFTERQKREAYEKQKGICFDCKKKFELSEMEADHDTPWSQGGRTEAANCRMMCRPCNRHKSDK